MRIKKERQKKFRYKFSLGAPKSTNSQAGLEKHTCWTTTTTPARHSIGQCTAHGVFSFSSHSSLGLSFESLYGNATWRYNILATPAPRASLSLSPYIPIYNIVLQNEAVATANKDSLYSSNHLESPLVVYIYMRCRERALRKSQSVQCILFLCDFIYGRYIQYKASRRGSRIRRATRAHHQASTESAMRECVSLCCEQQQQQCWIKFSRLCGARATVHALRKKSFSHFIYTPLLASFIGRYIYTIYLHTVAHHYILCCVVSSTPGCSALSYIYTAPKYLTQSTGFAATADLLASRSGERLAAILHVYTSIYGVCYTVLVQW